MKSHHKFNIKWHGFPENYHRKVKGVYMIGPNVYIGASIHIRRRILEHCREAIYHNNFCKKWPWLKNRKPLSEYILNQFSSKGHIEIYRLSDDPYDERIWIDILNPKSNNKSAKTYEQNYKASKDK